MSARPAPRSKRVVAAVVVLMLLLLALLFSFPRHPKVEPLPPPATVQVTIGKTTGRVERLGKNALWTPAAEGEAIALDEHLRTGEAGTAVLLIGKESTVTLTPKTEASVAKLTETISQLRLHKGRLNAVTAEGRSVQVDTGASEARIDSEGASEFVAMADGMGGLVVASREGKVTLSASGVTVAVAPGRQSSSSHGAAPTQPAAIPASLFLKLLPVPTQVKKSDTTITVKTQPGSRVRVNGTDVGIATSETMEVPIHLEPGENRIVLEVEDLTGRILSQQLTILLSDKDPIEIKTSVTW